MDASSVLTTLYLIILPLLAVYGFHRSSLVYLYYRHKDKQPVESGKFAELPAVTVQLPLFNVVLCFWTLILAHVAAQPATQAPARSMPS